MLPRPRNPPGEVKEGPVVVVVAESPAPENPRDGPGPESTAATNPRDANPALAPPTPKSPFARASCMFI